MGRRSWGWRVGGLEGWKVERSRLALFVFVMECDGEGIRAIRTRLQSKESALRYGIDVSRYLTAPYMLPSNLILLLLFYAYHRLSCTCISCISHQTFQTKNADCDAYKSGPRKHTESMACSPRSFSSHQFHRDQNDILIYFTKRGPCPEQLDSFHSSNSSRRLWKSSHLNIKRPENEIPNDLMQDNGTEFLSAGTRAETSE